MSYWGLFGTLGEVFVGGGYKIHKIIRTGNKLRTHTHTTYKLN